MHWLDLLFFTAVAGQAVYLVICAIGIFRTPRLLPPDSAPGVSVIVASHDDEAHLRELLPLLLAQDYPEYEVILVNDRSNDGTFDFLLGVQHLPRVRIVQVQHTPDHIQGKKYALTLGIKAARHEWILLTDADCRPGRHWVYQMAQAMKSDTDIVLGFSPYQVRPGFLNLFVRFETLFTALQMLGFAQVGQPYMGVGRNLAYRKSLFLEAKGFHPFQSVTGGDDDLFVNRLTPKAKTAAVLSTGSVVPSVPPASWPHFLHQKVRHLAVGKYYRPGSRLLLGVGTGSFLLHWLLLPIAMAGPFVVWAVGAIFVRWGCLALGLRALRARVGVGIPVVAIPVVDIVYLFYYLVTGVRAMASKNVRWKKN